MPGDYTIVKRDEMKILKKIDIYIIKKFLGTYFFAIALILAITVMFDINEKLDSFLKAPLSATIFDYFFNFLPYFANLFSPLFTFIAVIFFTSKLADNSEVIAMLSSGISFKRALYGFGSHYRCIESLFELLCNTTGQCDSYRVYEYVCQK